MKVKEFRELLDKTKGEFDNFELSHAFKLCDEGNKKFNIISKPIVSFFASGNVLHLFDQYQNVEYRKITGR